MPIRPDPEDVYEVERACGTLPPDASIEQCASRYRLAQAYKLIRLRELEEAQHRLPRLSGPER